MLENVYRLQIMNGTESTQHYMIKASGLPGLEIETEAMRKRKHHQDAAKKEHDKNSEDAKDDGQEDKHNDTIEVKSTQSRWVSVDLKIPDGTVETGSHKIIFEIEALESKEKIIEKSVFLVPR